MVPLTLKAPAKLNLRLKVEGRRLDGYHNLSMLNIALPLADEVRVELIDRAGLQLQCSGPYANAELNDPSKNLAAQAALEYLRRVGRKGGVSIEITKNIPCGAGLGGASSDAAAVLKLLYQAFGGASGESDRALHELAFKLGADLPFFFGAGFSHVTGAGEFCRDLPGRIIKGCSVVLIKPPCSISTREVFDLFRRETPQFQDNPDASGRLFVERLLAETAEAQELRQLIENDLQDLICRKFAQMKDAFQLADSIAKGRFCLTGSGSCIFAFFEQCERQLAESVYDEMARSSKYRAWLLEL